MKRKLKELFCNELFISILTIVIVLIIFSIGIVIMAKSDEKRCIKNGGTYIWEFGYSSKCHLK